MIGAIWCFFRGHRSIRERRQHESGVPNVLHFRCLRCGHVEPAIERSKDGHRFARHDGELKLPKATAKPKRYVSLDADQQIVGIPRAEFMRLRVLWWAWKLVLQADVCAYCNGPGGTMDHIEPVAFGGSDDPLNLTGACLQCNREKSALPMLSFIVWRRLRRQAFAPRPSLAPTQRPTNISVGSRFATLGEVARFANVEAIETRRRA